VKFLAVILFLTACATNPPTEEYTLARTALNAARDQDSARYAPSYWHQAEEAYRKGEGLFKAQEYKEAEEEFLKAKQFAEKAENTTRIQRFKSGEVTQ
jgi:hypothetical protein